MFVAFNYCTILKTIISERPYLFVVKNLPQIIVQHVCPVVVSLQQTSKLLKIGGVHKNTLQFKNELLHIYSSLLTGDMNSINCPCSQCVAS